MPMNGYCKMVLLFFCKIIHLFTHKLDHLQHKTIDSVLQRGEKLDKLVEKSSDLSAASQVLQFSLGYCGIRVDKSMMCILVLV